MLLSHLTTHETTSKPWLRADHGQTRLYEMTIVIAVEKYQEGELYQATCDKQDQFIRRVACVVAHNAIAAFRRAHGPR